MRWSIILVAVWVSALIFVGSATAQGPRKGPPRSGPPPGAFNSCKNKQTGGACSFRAPHGSIKGSCRTMPPGFVCVPGNLSGAGSGGKPNEGPGGSPGAGRAQGGPVGDIDRSMSARRGPPGYTPRAPYQDAVQLTNKLADTGQVTCFDNHSTANCQSEGSSFYGQDAHYKSRPTAYRDNGDGTVSDQNTGLTWQKAHNKQRLSHYDAKDDCESLNLGGYSDWRLPSIKELFSIADFSGATTHRYFLDSKKFDLAAPGEEVLEGDRFSTHHVAMMGQTWSETTYTGDHLGRSGIEAAFFFNFLDGHLKQAPTLSGNHKLFHRCVRGKEWGENQFGNTGDGTVGDRLTGLLWQQEDDGKERNWQQSLGYCENLSLAGRTDWRLPNIRELHTIIDYSRHNPAIDTDVFVQQDRTGWFWSSTTHGDSPRMASYICFGKCISVDGRDVHGAGAQRSDPKTGSPSQFESLGGQRDQVRINNYARCVTDQK